MKCFGMLEINKPAWMDKDVEKMGPLDVICEPVALTPCTSDVHSLHGGAGDRRNMVLGHEAVGRIVEAGRDVEKFKPGDVVVVPTTTPDWRKSGAQGKYNAHDEGHSGSYKFQLSKDGTFAELFHVNLADANLVPLPPDIPAGTAVMAVDMMSTGFHGAELADIEYGDTVVVIGIGPVGLMALAAAGLRGAGRLIGVGSRPVCAALAREYGAGEVVNYKEGDYIETIREMTGNGVDRVIVAGGTAETLVRAVGLVREGGTVANVTFFDPSETFVLPALTWGLGMGNKDIRGGFCPGGSRRIEKMLELIRHGRVDPSRMITHTYQGFDKIEDAFFLMEKKPYDLIKAVVYM